MYRILITENLLTNELISLDNQTLCVSYYVGQNPEQHLFIS